MVTNKTAWEVGALLVILAVLLASPSYAQVSDGDQTVDTEAAEHSKDHEDLSDYVWDGSDVVQIVLNDDAIAASGVGAAVDGSKVTITSGGTYSISGTLTDGQIVVDSSDKKTVRLLLRGIYVSCSDNAPVFIENAEKTIIVLAENTENYVADRRSYAVEDADTNEPKAAILSKDDLTFWGDGLLTIYGDFNDGISSKDGLVIAGGIIDISAADDGVEGKDYLVVRGGSVTVNAGGDGLKSDNDEDATMGYVSIEKGIIDVSSQGDAISAETDVVISDGEITLLTGGGLYGSVADSNSVKGIKAGVDVVIDGGNLTIDSADDAIHSDGNLAINGGAFVISSRDDGIHAQSGLSITGGEITIITSYEGIECADANVAISDGDIYINATDDGICAANSVSIAYGVIDVAVGGDAITADANVVITDGQITLYSDGGSNPRGEIPTSAKGIKAGTNVIINGGDFNIDSSDDAVHSDGRLEINEGTFVISTGDDGIRAQSDLVINGGEITILDAYEGIESGEADITINAGDIHITSSDDGLNVAGGGDNFGPGGPGRPGPGEPGRPGPGGGGFTPSTENCFLYINGGYIALESAGDGLDINGSVVMTDGALLVNGPTSNMNGALDYNSSFEMTGGFLLAAGSSGMAQAPSSSSTQYSILITFNSTISAGTLVHVETTAGEEVFTFAPTKSIRSIAFSSSQLARGTSYDVYYGGHSSGTPKDGLYTDGAYTPGTKYTTFTINSMVTNVRQ